MDDVVVQPDYPEILFPGSGTAADLTVAVFQQDRVVVALDRFPVLQDCGLFRIIRFGEFHIVRRFCLCRRKTGQPVMICLRGAVIDQQFPVFFPEYPLRVIRTEICGRFFSRGDFPDVQLPAPPCRDMGVIRRKHSALQGNSGVIIALHQQFPVLIIHLDASAPVQDSVPVSIGDRKERAVGRKIHGICKTAEDFPVTVQGRCFNGGCIEYGRRISVIHCQKTPAGIKPNLAREIELCPGYSYPRPEFQRFRSIVRVPGHGGVIDENGRKVKYLEQLRLITSRFRVIQVQISSVLYHKAVPVHGHGIRKFHALKDCFFITKRVDHQRSEDPDCSPVFLKHKRHQIIGSISDTAAIPGAGNKLTIFRGVRIKADDVRKQLIGLFPAACILQPFVFLQKQSRPCPCCLLIRIQRQRLTIQHHPFLRIPFPDLSGRLHGICIDKVPAETLLRPPGTESKAADQYQDSHGDGKGRNGLSALLAKMPLVKIVKGNPKKRRSNTEMFPAVQLFNRSPDGIRPDITEKGLDKNILFLYGSIRFLNLPSLPPQELRDHFLRISLHKHRKHMGQTAVVHLLEALDLLQAPSGFTVML